MRRAACVAGAVLIVALARGSIGAQQTLFRAGTDSVTVVAAISQEHRPVTGLSAADLVLLDNGVPQDVAVLSVGGVPLDLTVLLETTSVSTSRLETLNGRVRDLIGNLRPSDRLRVLTIDTYVEQVMPFSPPDAALSRAVQAPGARSASLHDALGLALLHAPDAGRVHLAVAFAREYDLRSAMSSATLREIARRSDTILHVVEIGADPIPRGRTMETRFRPDDNGRALLADVARSTGGYFHVRSVFGDRMLDAFRSVLTELHHAYVVQYVPKGVVPEGWHDIEVRVPSRPQALVRARKGYRIR